MLRSYFTKKWIFGGIAFLILFSVACVWWYHHDTATYRKTLTEAKDYLRKLEKAKQVSKVENDTEQVVSDVTEESIKQTVEEQEQVTNSVVVDTNASGTAPKNQRVRLSPNGFGPLPKVPRDYPDKGFRWRYYIDDPDFELIARVRLKIWTDQRIYARGASFINGKVYPILPDTAYVSWDTKYGYDGEIIQTYISEILWDHEHKPSAEQWQSASFNMSEYIDDVIKTKNLKVVDFENGGIDPYTFLNLEGGSK
ncbi:hypothetical protein F4X73_01700 [Candidatus Poribacteria bacterium]|nr:hypothetical protein [Candidatus Poribacteria bacterium]MYF55010.1 hypothetical protein [Candidatus Poribacteria bacterium]